MSTNTLPLEAETRVLIDRSLENLGWKLSGKDQNVYYEQPRTEAERKKLGGKRPDYVLYSKESDKPLIVIEAKKKGSRIDTALEQGIYYARAIEAPLVFATDGVFCKAFHTVANRPPILNGEEIDEFIREALALRYLTSYEVNTVSPKVQYDRKELIRIFDEANNMLRGEGLRAGIERFGEFANILFLKLISENEQIKRESGIKSNFDIACSWDSIKEIPFSTRIEYINKTVYERLNSLYNTEIFTPLQLSDPGILKDIMDKLDPLMLTDVDSDVKGDAFEYFLKASTSTKNDLGEYFTPRHIVKTMVRLVNPQIGEKVYDPFCGTGGFLIESFRHIYNNMVRTETNLKTLRESTVYGNEITNTARITKMNMILAGDGHSNIHKVDSLANPPYIDKIKFDEEGNIARDAEGNIEYSSEYSGLYDVVLANMPYSQKTKYGNLYDLPSKNGDSICVQHCIKAVNSAAPNGRMALVVPEGFLFRKDLTKTREYLLNNCQLQSVISLPQGVFLPYTGVKTDIIYATKVNQKIKQLEKKKDFWYFDVKSDGYTLDNHRRKLESSSDLSRFEEYRKLDDDQKDNMLNVGFEIISLDKVRKNANILVGSRYRTFSNESSKFPVVKFSEFAVLTRGVNYQKSQQTTCWTKNIILPADNISLLGELNIQKEIFVDDTVSLPEEKRLQKNDIFICMSSGSKEHIGKVAFIENDTNYYAGGFMGIIRTNPKKCLSKYLYFYMLASDRYKEELRLLTQGANINNISSTLNNIKIPLPPIEKQYKIIAELESYHQILSSAKRIVDNYTPRLSFPKDCKIVKLFDVCSLNEISINPQQEYGEEEFKYIDISSVNSNNGRIDTSQKIKGNNAPSRARRGLMQGDILMSTVRPNLKAFAYIDFDPKDCVASTGFAVLSPKAINGKYLYYMLLDDYVGQQLQSAMGKGMYPSVNKSDLEALNILLPSEEEQKKMVEQIESELVLIQPSEEIVDLFSEKISKKMEEVWSE